ncbi:MAG: GIY-YIG nuclease family protein [Planctomycetaceae bacterium]|nr:GIY-YIG nuclease family protein [Planctomycetaceae bacterium]
MAKNKSEQENQYIYIVQSSLEPSKCKIGKTNDLERRLKEYNNMTGVSKENIYQYLFTCEVKDMAQVESALKKSFFKFREEKSKEIYFYNPPLFKDYVHFIQSHPLFVREIFIKSEDKKQLVKIVRKTTPSLEARGLTTKDVLQKAQKTNNDEFYTRYEDVEKELSMYPKRIWKNKVVFCNCDDAVNSTDTNTSAFALYFLRNFNNLGLKKLICTHYAGKVDLFNQGPKGYIFTSNGFREFEYPKGYSGSFDDPLSLKILHEEADIVCTNPPFSRARDYWRIIIESRKKFLIISNITNVKNQPYMSYFDEEKVWAGYNEVDWFLNPKRELTRAAGHWYTNFPIKNRPKYKLLKIIPLKNIPERYKKYDDSKILLVDHCYIPSDYKKPFAVSVRAILNGLLEKGYKLIEQKEYVPYINGKRGFGRVLVKKV